MKKIVLSLAVLASVALVSCGNKAAEATDTDTTATEVVAEDTVATDTNVAADTNAAPAAEAAADTAKAQ
ncbi:MAG: hypothetical protein NC201_03150 [Prevotella sp.]|nr:hypothetical protein [Bacteroides sp.]MCM1366224.1 hypothetical protein [Prevotella sp.]MCM1436976.1 hypothetical protein [Prevotella sp.]